MHLKTRTAYAAWDHTVEFEGGIIVRLLPPTEAALRDAPPASRADLIDAAKGLVPEGARAVMETQSAAALVQFIQFHETLAAEWRAAQSRAIAGAAEEERRLTAEARRARRKAGEGMEHGGPSERPTSLLSWREQVGGAARRSDGTVGGSEGGGGAASPSALKLARELRDAGGEATRAPVEASG